MKIIQKSSRLFTLYWIVLSVSAALLIGFADGLNYVVFHEFLFLCVICLPFAYISYKLRQRKNISLEAGKNSNWKELWSDIFRYVTLISAISYLLLIAVIYEYGIRNVAKLPIYEVHTQGKKITLISMIHVASPEFYSTVQKKVLHHSMLSGSVVFFEGVKGGTPEAEKEFQLLTQDDLSQIYEQIASSAGLVSQSDERTLIQSSSTPHSLINIDMTIDEILERYKKRREKTPPTQTSQPIITPEERQYISELSNSDSHLERQFKSLLIRTTLSFTTRNQEVFMSDIPYTNQAFFDTILFDRNEKVITEISNHPSKDILIIYGSLHIPGIIEGIKKKDPLTSQVYSGSISIY